MTLPDRTPLTVIPRMMPSLPVVPGATTVATLSSLHATIRKVPLMLAPQQPSWTVCPIPTLTKLTELVPRVPSKKFAAAPG
jgi:hypothetical protein